MANPEAVMRAAGAQRPPMMDEGMPTMPGQPSGPAKTTEGPKGLDEMVSTLQGVGDFLQAQGPGAEKALATFKTLLQDIAQLGGPASQPPMEPSEEEREPGRIHESQAPGVRVL